MQPNPSNIALIESACDAISALTGTSAFQNRFTDVRLIRSVEEIGATGENLPSAFLPFMTEQQPDSIDIYAFDLGDDSGGKIVVWNDHAVVADWLSFDAFIGWLRGGSVDT
jgi:hypothetical protein